MTRTLAGPSDLLMRIFAERGVEAFRFNTDLFDRYKVNWEGDDFSMEDPVGRVFDSRRMTAAAFYKNFASIDEQFEYDFTHEEPKYIRSWLNAFNLCVVRHAMERRALRLWTPEEHLYTKPLQMKVAAKYFAVPRFRLSWGRQLPAGRVIAKHLTQRRLEDGRCLYAKLVEASDLDPAYPWFTQQPASGDRDATVLYINGRVHCYCFAETRGELADWRVTQGTERNRWQSWDAGADFERKVELYMREMGLKFGRLDFIIGGDAPEFLEVNPNGQFGWLDDDKLTLHNEVADALLDPSSTLQP